VIDAVSYDIFTSATDTPVTGKPFTAKAAEFQEALAKAVNTSASAQAATPSQDEPSATSADSYNFAAMTSQDMYQVAAKLFDAGEIDLDQLFYLQNLGVPLGKLSTDGVFTPLSDEERQYYRSQTQDYHQLTQQVLSDLAGCGRATDPTSGYESWKQLQQTLRRLQS
jgi:hypothetical protein